MWSMLARPVLAAAISALVFVASIMPSDAGADTMTSEQLRAAAPIPSESEQVAGFMTRDDVRGQLFALDINPNEAASRVVARSNAKAGTFGGPIADVPAGADALASVIGAAGLIIVLLLITDIAGLTSVFAFTRSVRR